MKNAETLMAVHTHTHTHTSNLNNKIKEINKNSTNRYVY